MVKTVVGEETQLKLSETRLSQSAILSQVGLVIGKLSSSLDRGFVFDLIPTPPNDSGEPPCSLIEPVKDDRKKGSRGKSQNVSDSSSLAIDSDWVAEHARQVSRMLVGGIKVVGIYIWASDGAFKNSSTQLCQAIKGVADAAPLPETDLDERLLIHICFSPLRWTCRNCSLASNITSSSLRPCDFKMGRVLHSLQKFRCTYNFDIRLPISHENASKVRLLSNVLLDGISVIAKELRGAKALIDGNLVVGDEQCTSDRYHDVELLVPFMKDTHSEACSSEDVIGVLIFSGSVCSFSFLNSKEPISQAITDIKGDIIMSLRSRLDIVSDEADDVIPPTDDNPIEENSDIPQGKFISKVDLQLLRKPSSVSFPRRVFAPWLAGTVICDYLQSSETLEVIKDHSAELLSMEVPTDASCVLEPEGESTAIIARSFWDVAASFSLHSTPSIERNGSNTAGKKTSSIPTTSSNFGAVAAILVLLFSILVGYLLLNVRTS